MQGIGKAAQALKLGEGDTLILRTAAAGSAAATSSPLPAVEVAAGPSALPGAPVRKTVKAPAPPAVVAASAPKQPKQHGAAVAAGGSSTAWGAGSHAMQQEGPAEGAGEEEDCSSSDSEGGEGDKGTRLQVGASRASALGPNVTNSAMLGLAWCAGSQRFAVTLAEQLLLCCLQAGQHNKSGVKRPATGAAGEAAARQPDRLAQPAKRRRSSSGSPAGAEGEGGGKRPESWRRVGEASYQRVYLQATHQNLGIPGGWQAVGRFVAGCCVGGSEQSTQPCPPTCSICQALSRGGMH